MSNLRTLADRGDRRPLFLFYGNATWEEVILREEIEELKACLDLRVVHVLEDPPEDWEGEEGYITPEVLVRHLPDEWEDLEYFICGPDPLIDAVETALVQELGNPPRQGPLGTLQPRLKERSLMRRRYATGLAVLTGTLIVVVSAVFALIPH